MTIVQINALTIAQISALTIAQINASTIAQIDASTIAILTALRLLKQHLGPQTTVQSPLRWRTDASWKRDYSNLAQMSAEELARRRREFDAQKEIARGIRESAA